MTHQINKVPKDCRDIRRKVGNNGDMGMCVNYAHRQRVYGPQRHKVILLRRRFMALVVQIVFTHIYVNIECVW